MSALAENEKMELFASNAMANAFTTMRDVTEVKMQTFPRIFLTRANVLLLQMHAERDREFARLPERLVGAHRRSVGRSLATLIR
jgi:hypothetical protein